MSYSRARMPSQYPAGMVPCPHCEGTGWWSDRWNDVKNVAGKVADFAKPLLKPAASAVANWVVPGSGAAVNAGLSALGLGRPRPRRISARMHERNEVVKAVMRERGVNLPTASSIVKREGLF